MGIAAHAPAVQRCPAGHVAPAQASMHDPAWQTRPAGQVTAAQAVSTQ
jgi:hypothetical protein